MRKRDLRRQLAEEVRCRKYAEHRLYVLQRALTEERKWHEAHHEEVGANKKVAESK